MRFALFAGAGLVFLCVTLHEAAVLFKTSDAICEARNASTWNDLFARAVGNHLMARAHPEPQSVNDALAREAWLSDTSFNPGRVFSGMGASVLSGSWLKHLTHNEKKAAKARQAAAEAADREAEKVNEAEHAFLLQGIGLDGKISPAERALIEFLKKEAPGFTNGLVETS